MHFWLTLFRFRGIFVRNYLSKIMYITTFIVIRANVFISPCKKLQKIIHNLLGNRLTNLFYVLYSFHPLSTNEWFLFIKYNATVSVMTLMGQWLINVGFLMSWVSTRMKCEISLHKRFAWNPWKIIVICIFIRTCVASNIMSVPEVRGDSPYIARYIRTIESISHGKNHSRVNE